MCKKFPQFFSSDQGLDAFLNDFLRRNLRIDDTKVGWSPEEIQDFWVMFYKEWDTMNLLWFNSSLDTLPVNRKKALKEYLLSVPVDKYGYTWSTTLTSQPSTDGPTRHFNQGWVFPDYTQSRGNSTGWEFNKWDTEGWSTSEVNLVHDGYLDIFISGHQADVISPELNIDSFHAPFLEIDFKISGVSAEYPVDGIKVYWQTQEEPFFSEDKSVNSRKDCTIPIENITNEGPNYLFFPMYLQDKWNGKKIIKLKIVIMNSNREKDKNFLINFIRLNYDTRQPNNNAILINASALYYLWTGDREFLIQNMPRMRKALMFMNEHMGGKERGLIDFSYMPGHDGIRGTGHGIGNGYWDIISLGQVDICSTTYYFRSLKFMQRLEEIIEKNNIEVERPYVVSSGVNELLKYQETSRTLEGISAKVRDAFQETFWNDEKGRFIGGIDSKGRPIDYGFIMFNLEALESGLATPEQEKLIMEWVDGKRLIEGERSTGKDIYYFEFAPRTTTIKNDTHYIWEWDGTAFDFGHQVQDGGAVMYTAYYDLFSRIKVLGVENAFARLKQIQKWYENVLAAGGEGPRLYSEYYKDAPIKLQGLEGPGGIGLKDEFLESALMYSIVPFGFLGLAPQDDNVLNVEPSIPEELKYWGIKNLMFQGVFFDLECSKDYIEVNNVVPGNSSKKVKITINKKSNMKIVVSMGEKDIQITESDNSISFLVPLQNGIYRILKEPWE